MLVGRAAGKTYSARQLLAAALITAGLGLSTAGGSQLDRGGGGAGGSSGGSGGGEGSLGPTPSSEDGAGGAAFCGGVLALAGALLARASGGVVQAAGAPLPACALALPPGRRASPSPCTLAPAPQPQPSALPPSPPPSADDAQERAFAAHGVHAGEVVFYRAALGLPFFAWRGRGLLLGAWGGAGAWGARTEAPGADWAVAGLPLPRMHLLLAANVVCDYCCKVGRVGRPRPLLRALARRGPRPTPHGPAARQVAMTRLIGESSALTATMVITLQRFVSLLFSATVLSATYPPAALWAGMGLVAGGSVMHLAARSPPCTGGKSE